MPSPRIIEQSNELARLCDRWSQARILALDTEFVRTRTFYARLGLIQVADDRGVYLIDTVAIEDLAPFAPVLRGGARMILHSCGEDLGIFLHELEVLPRDLFDTQVAASLVGLGFSLSYQALVAEILDHQLDKGETRSNWMARPLSESQIEYAGRDVEFLIDVHEFLAGRLRDLGRESWAREEFDRLNSPARYIVEPDEAYLRVRGRGSLDRRGQAILQALCAWREGEAQRRDLARGFVVRDHTLLTIARTRPRSQRQVRELKGVGNNEGRRYASVFVELVEEALGWSESRLPSTRPRGPRVGQLAELVKGLQRMVAARGREIGVAPEVLAQRRVLERLVRDVVGSGRAELPEELRGWREEVVGRPALDFLRRTV